MNSGKQIEFPTLGHGLPGQIPPSSLSEAAEVERQILAGRNTIITRGADRRLYLRQVPRWWRRPFARLRIARARRKARRPAHMGTSART